MIVDCHVHGFPSRGFLGATYDDVVKRRKEAYFEFYKEMAWMHTAGLGTAEEIAERGLVDNLIAEMDRCEVDNAILAHFHPFPIGWKVEMMKEYPDRLYAYASVNPKGGKSAIRDLEEQSQQSGIVGVKFGPPYQEFYPNDENIYPLYEKAMELDLPVAFHTGWAPAGHLKYSLPIYLDDVASDFPKLKIIGCHMGGGWFNDFALVATKNPNIYADFSGCLEYTSIRELTAYLERLVRSIGAGKILLGSDYPLFRMAPFLEIARGLRLKEEERSRILGTNAAEIFRFG